MAVENIVKAINCLFLLAIRQQQSAGRLVRGARQNVIITFFAYQIQSCHVKITVQTFLNMGKFAQNFA